MARKQKGEFPFSLEDRTGCTTYPIIAVMESFEAVRVVHRILHPEPSVVDRTILRAHICPDRETCSKERNIYYVPPASENPISTHLASLRQLALEVGATPEAVRLLGSIEPWTKKEEATLAEKLKAKASRAKPATDELKQAAKAAPVGGKKTADAPKKKGNAEALAKARAARSTGPDTRKIKGLVKAKDLAARPGTFRRTMLEDLLSSKTVQEWREKDKKYDASCLKFAVDQNIVSVS